MAPVDRDGRTPLHQAAFENDVLLVTRLLEEGADPDIGDKRGFRPLHMACQQWSVEAAEVLLNAGANVDATNVFGNTPLHVAVVNSQGRGELIHLLRALGADPLHANKSGGTPLARARMVANYDIAQYFADLP
jgi:ankyrin repeat protein